MRCLLGRDPPFRLHVYFLHLNLLLRTNSITNSLFLFKLNKKYFILRRKRREWLPKSPEPDAHVKTFDSREIDYTSPPGSTSPTLFEQQCGFFYIPFQSIRRYEGDKANGLTSPPNDAII